MSCKSQIGKSVFAAERGSYGVALNVFCAGQELAFFITYAIKHRDVMAVQRLRSISFLKDGLYQGVAVGDAIQRNRFQRDDLLVLRVQRLVHSRKRGLR